MIFTPTLLKLVKNQFKKHNFFPQKRLGQNFLIDKRVFKKIIEAANLKTKDIVLEIGPGPGNLTKELAKKVKKVIVIEKDPNLIRILSKELKINNIKNVKIIQGDILNVLNSKLLTPNFCKVVANLPFYLTAPIIRKFLESPPNNSFQMILLIQKEVAQRICAKPPRMNLLAVSVQYYAEPKIISYVFKKSFWPRPNVDSAIIKIIPHNQFQNLLITDSCGKKKFTNLLFQIVRAGFSQPRKYLLNNLSNMLKLDKEKTKNWLLKNNIKPNQRAETLSIENWIKLAKSFRVFSSFVLISILFGSIIK